MILEICMCTDCGANHNNVLAWKHSVAATSFLCCFLLRRELFISAVQSGGVTCQPSLPSPKSDCCPFRCCCLLRRAFCLSQFLQEIAHPLHDCGCPVENIFIAHGNIRRKNVICVSLFNLCLSFVFVEVPNSVPSFELLCFMLRWPRREPRSFYGQFAPGAA